MDKEFTADKIDWKPYLIIFLTISIFLTYFTTSKTGEKFDHFFASSRNGRLLPRASHRTGLVGHTYGSS